MNEIGFKEMQKIELEILKYFHQVCVLNDLRYSLTYGTLLGAVRHQGFIPWDDDIDIMMPREDYDKLLKLSQEFDKHDLELMDISINKNYIHPIGKLINKKTFLKETVNEDWCPSLGVYIDIFPLDNLSDNANADKNLIQKNLRLNLLRSILCMKYENLKSENMIKNFIICLLKKVLNLWKPMYFLEKQKKLLMKCKNNKSLYVKNLSIPEKKNDILNIKEFDNLIQLPFESCYFHAIKDYQLFLKEIYGDYMELPAIEERVPSHNVEVYWK